MTAPTPSEIRFRVDPGDIPPEKAARRLHLSLEHFQKMLPDLLKRGFPPADETTGMYDLEAIDLWRKGRHRSIVQTAPGFALAGFVPGAQPSPPVRRRLGERTHGDHSAAKRS